MKVIVVAAVIAALTLASARAAPIAAYSTEKAAQKHCPGDEVVYGENKSDGVYHLKGERYYGHLKSGKYVCRKEADAGGWRASKNNQ